MNLKKKEILFSVVIPLYNKEKYIYSTIESVLEQEYQNFEIIIVNDGSADSSLDIAKKVEDSRISIFSIINSGVSIARNEGIKKAKGDYIALLDADDYWYPDHLITFLESIEKYPKELIFCNNYKIQFSKNNYKIPRYSYLPSKNKINRITDFYKSSMYNSIAWVSAVCLSKSIFLNEGYWFDDKIRSGEDTDLWVRLALKKSFVHNNEITAIHKKYIPLSLSKSNNEEYLFEFSKKYLLEEKNNLSLKKYMDINRFSILIKYKTLKKIDRIKNLRAQIDFNNLNYKQRLIINLPNFTIPILNYIKKYFNSNGIYFSIFK